jgi:exodeoxyribonuclease-3
MSAASARLRPKGLFRWLRRQKADFICLQETKSQEHQLAEHDVQLTGYHSFFCDAERPGYAGVAIYSRHEPDRIVRGFGTHEFDLEGRYLEAQVGDLSVVSVYLPSGSAGPHPRASKFRFLEAFDAHQARLRRRRRHPILSGGWNIAHRPIACATGRRTRRTPASCLSARLGGPPVRCWLRGCLRECARGGPVHCWSPVARRAPARQLAHRPGGQWHLAGAAASIYKDRRFSDHAPRSWTTGFGCGAAGRAARRAGEPRSPSSW